MQTNIYIARKTSINVYIHLSDYWSGRKLKKIELSCTIKFSVFQTILDKTLETSPANITKLLNIDKTNFVSPSPPSSMLWTTPKQLLVIYHDTSSTLSWGSGGLRMATWFNMEFIIKIREFSMGGINSLKQLCPRLSECGIFTCIPIVWELWLERQIC